ncbi:oligosaccharide flippase family protein [Vibrio sp. Vb2131]|uniref:oligosaccharide flippase family protein n=1 Tax=Vibrio sp. Vb2131 TaxID=3074649 RepID=UPI002963FAEC|nr:oligosaccharide flippase family protein [Vibrio sp. Vb2131]MDW1886842.1 oligosaccharide flippase family protein [Vibrio sp. Vb2131]
MKSRKLVLQNGECIFAVNLVIKAFVQVAQLVILARFLTPEELGIIAILVMVSGLAQTLSDSGLSSAIIYDKHDSCRSSVLNFSVILGVILVFATLLLVELFSINNINSKYIDPFRLFSLIFLFRSVSGVILSYLQKDLKFKLLAKVELISSLLYISCVLLFILSGYGVSGYIYSQYVLALTTLLISLIYSKGWLKFYKMEVNLIKMRTMISYGSYQLLDSLVNYVSSQIDQFIIASNYGVKSLGIYSNVRNLVFRPSMLIVNPIINKVVFPKLCVSDEDKSRSEQFISIFSFLAVTNVLIYMNFALNSEFVISIVFGESWRSYSSLLTLLAIYMFIISVGVPSGLMLKVLGKVNISLYWNIFVTIVRLVSLFILSEFEIEVMIAGMIAVQIIVFVLNTKFVLNNYLSFSFSFVIYKFIKPMLVFSVCWVIVRTVIDSIPIGQFFSNCLVVVISSLIYIYCNRYMLKSLLVSEVS